MLVHNYDIGELLLPNHQPQLLQRLILHAERAEYKQMCVFINGNSSRVLDSFENARLTSESSEYLVDKR
eukprot:1908089-Pleurochrysis_carterae.AAC.1